MALYAAVSLCVAWFRRPTVPTVTQHRCCPSLCHLGCAFVRTVECRQTPQEAHSSAFPELVFFRKLNLEVQIEGFECFVWMAALICSSDSGDTL